MSEFSFNCPFCNLELSVDQTHIGSEVECPGCNEQLLIPGPEQADGDLPSTSAALASAEILKPKNRPLDIAAKVSKTLKIKTFRHHDFVADGKDTFDEEVSSFIGKLMEDDIVSIRPIQYSHAEKVKGDDDKETERVVTQYGMVIVYKSLS